MVGLDELPLDREMFERVARDMRRCAGHHLPIDAWLKLGEHAVAAEKLAYPWLGFGTTRFTAEASFWWHDYLTSIDRLGRLMSTGFGIDDSMAIAGTLLDLNLATAFLADDERPRPLRVLEIGGGYGRLAEAFLDEFENVKYLLVDAVPASLIYANEYLTRSSTESIGWSFYERPWSEDADWFIVPSWHLREIPLGGFDLAINVCSMQEMSQWQVDFYIGIIDRALRPGGLVYLCNRRDYLFRGKWNFPTHWECLLKTHTPRSWLKDFPAEIFRKHERHSFQVANALRHELYLRNREAARNMKEAAARELGYPFY